MLTLFIVCVYLCVCVLCVRARTYATAQSEEILWESVLSLYRVSSRNQTQAVRLGSRHFNRWASPLPSFPQEGLKEMKTDCAEWDCLPWNPSMEEATAGGWESQGQPGVRETTSKRREKEMYLLRAITLGPNSEFFQKKTPVCEPVPRGVFRGSQQQFFQSSNSKVRLTTHHLWAPKRIIIIWKCPRPANEQTFQLEKYFG